MSSWPRSPRLRRPFDPYFPTAARFPDPGPGQAPSASRPAVSRRARAGAGTLAPQLTCAGCLETGAEQLAHHVSEAWPHVRVDECKTCGRYQKTVDLRTAGDAVPVVDELASIELDVWAEERGLRKLERNLLGL